MGKKNQDFVKHIADINVDFPQWYTDVIIQAELVDYGPVKGTMVIRPNGYGIWENIQKELDARFKETGHVNAYFPMLIPESYLTKEAEHVEGFAPEVAWVTHGGNEKLTERLAIRPTSETIVCAMYAKWLQSYRDLPILMNQWANVVRWEKSTRPFLRTSEFLWQEGHTVHETAQEAIEEAVKMHEVYTEFSKNVLAIPMVGGKKTDKEKFAGALDTYTIEALMKDGKVLQSGTSHYLGQNFAKAFDIKFQSREGKEELGWSTSWGVSTRLIGAVIMVHGDQRGLVLPPKVAPTQVVIVPVMAKKEGVLEACEKVYNKLKQAGVRVRLDDRDTVSPGWKYNEHELKGIPLRLEIGPRDLENNQAFTMRRDTLKKSPMSLDNIEDTVVSTLNDIQKNMYDKALQNLNEHIFDAKDMDELAVAINEKKGYVRAHWCEDEACEMKIKEELGATSRCIKDDEMQEDAKCVCCKKQAKHLVYWAKAY